MFLPADEQGGNNTHDGFSLGATALELFSARFKFTRNEKKDYSDMSFIKNRLELGEDSDQQWAVTLVTAIHSQLTFKPKDRSPIQEFYAQLVESRELLRAHMENSQ